jgi:hypothetical protein
MRTTFALAALMALGAAHARAEDPSNPDPGNPEPTAAASTTAAATTGAATGTPATATATKAPATTISGKAYVDLSYRENVDRATDRAADKGNGTAFDIKRFYLGVDHAFNDTWGARIRTDVGNLTNGKFDVFVKNAYLEARVAPELVLRAGSADLPWIPFVEDLYGFRYVENVLIDRVKLGTSADWGVHAGGKLGGGLASYAVSVVNGRGYGDPTRTQAPTVEGRVAISPVKELTVGVGGQAGKLGQNVVGTPTPRTAERVDAVVAWVSDVFRLGAAGFLARDYDKKIVTDRAQPQDKAVGGSGWASVTILPPLTLFGRVDYIQPKRDTLSSFRDLYFDAGLAVKPAKPVDLALVYKGERVKHGALSTSNGTIGSAVAGEKGRYDEVGVFAQYVF